jgi:hypothetical protein
MPSKRSLGRRHTFCISLDFGQIDFFTSSRRNNPHRESSPESVTEEVSDVEVFESGGEAS